MSRQRYGKGGASAKLALDIHGAAVHLNDLVNDGQAQSGSFGTGSKKGIEYALNDGGLDAVTGIGYFDLNRPIGTAVFRMRRNI
jgi:hypothetical protein